MGGWALEKNKMAYKGFKHAQMFVTITGKPKRFAVGFGMKTEQHYSICES